MTTSPCPGSHTGVSCARLYQEYKGSFFNDCNISVPAAVSVFPEEVYQAPRSWTERAYPNLVHFNAAREGRALCRLGTAATVFRRSSGGLQIAAQIVDADRSETGRRGSTSSLFARARRMFAQPHTIAAVSWDGRPVAGCCMDRHERFGDPVDHGETIPAIRRKRPGLARRATAWLNSAPLTAADLRGKVVLVDFWTYTCINWLRTLPYVRAWAARYKDQGLVVIGVHTPEFSFEEDVDNVRRAAKEIGVTYPIAIDNDRAIWRGFANHYWPALYFIDAAGRVRDHHFGEGNYEESEMRIRRLLAPPEAAAGSIVSPCPSRRVVQKWPQTGAA